MIINYQSFPYLCYRETGPGIEFKNSSSIIGLLENSKKILPENRYWYVEFHSGASLSQLSNGSVIFPGILKQIIQGSTHLLLCNSHEAFHSTIDWIYKIAIIKMGIPAEQITIISESADIQDEIAKIAAIYRKGRINAVWSRLFESNVHRQLQDQMYANKIIRPPEFKHYEKKYINFNRRWRLHRPTMVGLLHARNLLSKGYVSLAPSDDNKNWETEWDNIEYYNSDDRCPYVLETLNNYKDELLKLLPMYLDTDELMANKAELSRATDEMYSNTYFSLVSETNFYTRPGPFEPGRFFSEKIFKPIAEKHPFVLINPPNSLPLLHSLGYKTFHPFIDERYDAEPNDVRRLMLILNEVERLCRLNDDQLHDFINGIQEICEHNYCCLRDKDPTFDFLTFLV
jgi:hypothetical protein